MKNNLILKVIAGITLVSSLSACLKDNSQPDFTKDKPIIELPVGSSAGNGGPNSIAASLTVSNTPSNYFIYVNYAAPNANSKDVVVTLAVDTAALSKFNSVNGTTYTLLPPSGYSLSNKVTIPTGQRKVQYPIKVNTSVLDPTKVYALPITITDGDGYTISGNFGTLISIISLKNKWDGVYTLTGTMIDNTTTAITGLYPQTLQLITQGPNTVAVYSPAQSAYAVGIKNAGSNSYYGSFSPVFTIDPTTNVVTGAVNYYGQPSSNGRTAKLDPTGTNAFTMSADGTTPVTLKIKYIMNQNGSDRTFFDETWTYTSSR
jgi:hypothetical protein